VLTLYRRHLADCPHKKKGRGWKRCGCPVWFQGMVEGRRVRESLDTRNWEVAAKKVLSWEAGKEKEERITIGEAVRRFLDDCVARSLKNASIKKYRVILEKLKDFSARRNLTYVQELDGERVRKFREEWNLAPISAMKSLERVKVFFRAAQNWGWILKNPTVGIKNPQVRQCPTLSFSEEELERIRGACNTEKHRLMVEVLVYTGLRISDVMRLGPDCLRDGNIFLHTAKTGVAVSVPIPEWLSEKLAKLDAPYWFWNREGESSIETATGNARRAFRKIFRRASVNGHLHRFRDTASVRWLLGGVPLEEVSILLGHSSVRITERHYAPFVKERQVRLEELVRASWK
jgi:integrase/recombinase XerD